MQCQPLLHPRAQVAAEAPQMAAASRHLEDLTASTEQGLKAIGDMRAKDGVLQTLCAQSHAWGYLQQL